MFLLMRKLLADGTFSIQRLIEVISRETISLGDNMSKLYRSEVYGDLFQFDIDKVAHGKIGTPDGEISYHRIGDKVVYDTNETELSTIHLWEIERDQKGAIKI